MKKRELIYLAVIALLGACLVCNRSWHGPRDIMRVQTRTDTVFVRDTLRDTVLIARERFRVRIDTVWLKPVADTVPVAVAVPVERTVYRTDEYRAVVEGYRSSLTEMEIYRTTRHVNSQTVIRPPVPRWGIGVQVGYGYNFDRVRPYIGVGIQYNVISW